MALQPLGANANGAWRFEVRVRLGLAGDVERLNVDHHGLRKFEDARIELPLLLRHEPLNTGLLGRVSRTTRRARGERLCPTRSRPGFK